MLKRIGDTNDGGKRGGRLKLTAAYVVKTAVMAALLTSLKLALSFIPNVEVVTLLILVYAAVFGAAYALPAVLVFCCVEISIYGVASWVLLYFIYWPLLAFGACIILKRRKTWKAVLYAVAMSAFFGVLSACCDTLVTAAGFPDVNLAQYFAAYYVRGLYFDLVHCVSNLAVVAALFAPLCFAAERVKRASAPGNSCD